MRWLSRLAHVHAAQCNHRNNTCVYGAGPSSSVFSQRRISIVLSSLSSCIQYSSLFRKEPAVLRMEGLRRSGRGIIIETNKPRRSPAYIGCARHHPSERYPSKLETNISIGCFAMLQGRLPVVCAFRFPIPSSNSKSSAIYILGVYFFYLISVCHCFSVRRCFINFFNDRNDSGFC